MKTHHKHYLASSSGVFSFFSVFLCTRLFFVTSLMLQHSTVHLYRARICKPFKDPMNRFPAGRAGTTTLFVVQATKAGGIRIYFWAPQTFTNTGSVLAGFLVL